ncbi:MAG: rhomboid family intramembrane serine protease [Chitinophagia bacterium]|nr:rhomboid family intramembrane serine protease [Chitinophagia bacterium]
MFVIYILIAATCIISFLAFNNPTLLNKLLLYPRVMTQPNEFYRTLSSGFVHADYQHLLFNMMTLYFFAEPMESVLREWLHLPSNLVLFFFYLSAIVISSLPALRKHRNNPYYRALGASGGVSAVVFFTIFYFPWAGIRIYFIPIGIPAIIYGVLYVGYSYFMSKRGNDSIGHDAHLSGAIFGFLFALLVDPGHGLSLLVQLMRPHFDGL